MRVRFWLIALAVFLISQVLTVRAEAFVFIHEFLADPATGLSGDANNDGVRSAYDDEFVELFNSSLQAIDISNWSISDAVSERHFFSANTIIEPYRAFVVFGGGLPNLPGIAWQIASSGTLSLNNLADTITFRDAYGQVIDSYTYGLEANNDQSIVRNPEGSKGEWIKHTQLSNANGKLFSPGYLINEINPPIENVVPEPSTILCIAFVFGLMVLNKRVRPDLII